MSAARRWLLIILGGAVGAGCQGCGIVPPPQPASCTAALAHFATLNCATSVDLETRICDAVATNQPTFPACVAVATSCQAVDACR